MMYQICLDDGRPGTFVLSFQLYPDISPEINCVYQNKQLYLSQRLDLNFSEGAEYPFELSSDYLFPSKYAGT